MKVESFQLDSTLNVSPCPYARALELSKAGDSSIWMDVQGTENGELGSMLDQLGIKDLARRLCMEARERPGFYPLNSYIFMVIPVQASADHLHDLEYVSILSNKNLLITLRDVSESRLQEVTKISESADWLHNETIEGLLCTVLMILSLDITQKLAGLREATTRLEKRMKREPFAIDMKEISENRSRLLTLEAVVNGQLPCLQALLATNKHFFDLGNGREHLASALANLEAANRSLQWLEGRLDVVRSDFEMLAQDKLNRRLGRLTILSLIFMPMTFLAGIWGMNFDNMPELSSPYGYWIALGMMLVMGSGMFFYFRRKGWFE